MHAGIVDPPQNMNATFSCHGDEHRVDIEWESPSTLHGVEITHYTFSVEGMNYNASGNERGLSETLPSCQNQTICGAASTVAGMSAYKCIEGTIVTVYIAMSENMVVLSMEGWISFKLPTCT